MAETAAAAPSTPASSPTPATTPAAPAVPAAAAPPPAAVATPVPAPAPAPAAPPPATVRPEWITDAHAQWWDGTLNTLNFDTIRQHLEGQVALSQRKVEDIKFPTKLPDDLKLPEGTTWKLKPDDPFAAAFRQVAVEKGFTQDQIDAVHNMWARKNVGDYVADQQAAVEYEAAENKKLGDNAQQRKETILAWIGGSGLEPAERVEAASWLTNATAVVAFEKIMRKIIGGVPHSTGGQMAPANEPAAPPKTIAQRMYPNMPSREAPQQKAG